ncbi:1035_t:CDS:1, partial [Paraglomus occultum]
QKDSKFTPALRRARRPCLVQNALTGIGFLGFVGAVCILSDNKRMNTNEYDCYHLNARLFYAYLMYAVKQDDFSDVGMPPLPPR